MPAFEAITLVMAQDVTDYDFGPSHPLRPERVLLTYDHIERLGFHELEGLRRVESGPASDVSILRAHDADYVTIVKTLGDRNSRSRGGLQYGLGTDDNPIFGKMHEASAAVCGATATAASTVASGEATCAFSPAGGLHHARRNEASGFCIYNDPAVAIYEMLEINPQWRVMYLDVDVHHGDGVQWIFYDDPRVLTLSLHQSGPYFYPGTGFETEIGEGDARGTSANIPLAPGTGEEDYLWVLEETLAPLAAAFRPDVLVTQLGADTHHGDPLAQLSLTMPAYPRMACIIHEVVRSHCKDRWVATGGGGYQAETVVPKVWTMHFAEMCGAPELIPAAWLEDVDPGAVAEANRRAVEGSARSVLTTCLPLLEKLPRDTGGWGGG
ncbi:MAG: acetoin utilization protein AcuC [Actinobacteria bacterium]|nr:acetoin utilization protein AcuC [Actinomycetota bacterium]